jgi:hypothetical protein
MAQAVGTASNILVGASPLFISNVDNSDQDYVDALPGTGTSSDEPGRVAFETSKSYIETLNGIEQEDGDFGFRNVGFTNNGLQITYNPTYENVTVDQLLDSAKVFKSAMEVSIATEMTEGTLENILVVFGQSGATKSGNTLGLAAGALGEAPIERQLIAVGRAPQAVGEHAERVYYARRVLSVQQSQFSLARNTATTFPVTFRLLPSGAAKDASQEYGVIIDRTWTPA